MDQIEEAVRCALDPNTNQEIRYQANEYCEQLRNSPEGWRMCLELFVSKPTRTPESRMYSLQVVEGNIYRNIREPKTGELELTKQVLMKFIVEEYGSDRYLMEAPFLRNKLAHTIALMFLATYPHMWAEFFREILSITGVNFERRCGKQEQRAKVHEGLTDFTIKVLASIDEEMVNPTIPRGKSEIARNTMIKDKMREEGVLYLANWWYNTITTEAAPIEIIKNTLRLVSVYITWIDIKLIVNEEFIPVIFEFLGHEGLKGEAVKCLAAIVEKGMVPMEKIELVEFLNLGPLLRQLVVTDNEFGEQVARLVSVLGRELNEVWMKKDEITVEVRGRAYMHMEGLMGLILGFLGSESDEVSSAVIEISKDILHMFKRQKREGIPLSGQQTEFLSELLQVTVMKLMYKADHEVSEITHMNDEISEDDEETMFAELRKQLRTFLDSVLSLAPELYNMCVVGKITEIYTNIQQCGVSIEAEAERRVGKVGWEQAELALFLTHTYIEQVNATGELAFVQKSGTGYGDKNGAGGDDELAQQPLTVVGELGVRMLVSKIVDCMHPYITLLFFETCIKIGGLFEARKDALSMGLGPFLDERGICHPSKHVRTRVWYLFLRFIKNVGVQLLVPYIPDIMQSILPHLTIQIDPQIDVSNPEMLNVLGHGIFDSQIYLFEICGVVLSPLSFPDDQRSAFLNQLLDPLLLGLGEIMNQSVEMIAQQPIYLLQTRNILAALGAVAMGFPEAKVRVTNDTLVSDLNISPVTKEALVKAADTTIAVLERLNGFSIVREGVRLAFVRLLSALGQDALGYLPRLIGGLLPNCLMNEFSDFLAFLGLVMHKFKPFIAQTMSELVLVVVEKAYSLMNTSIISGTDDAVMLADLKRAYLGWFGAIFSADLDIIFLVPANARHISIVFGTLLDLATDCLSPQLQKMAFNIFQKTILAWLVDTRGDYAVGNISLMQIGSVLNSGAVLPPKTQRLPGNGDNSQFGVFGNKDGNSNTSTDANKKMTSRQLAARSVGIELVSVWDQQQREHISSQQTGFGSTLRVRQEYMMFIQNQVVPLCFTIPTNPMFNSSDAQSSQVITELCGILRGLTLANMEPNVINQGTGPEVGTELGEQQRQQMVRTLGEAVISKDGTVLILAPRNRASALYQHGEAFGIEPILVGGALSSQQQQQQQQHHQPGYCSRNNFMRGLAIDYLPKFLMERIGATSGSGGASTSQTGLVGNAGSAKNPSGNSLGNSASMKNTSGVNPSSTGLGVNGAAGANIGFEKSNNRDSNGNIDQSDINSKCLLFVKSLAFLDAKLFKAFFINFISAN